MTTVQYSILYRIHLSISIEYTFVQYKDIYLQQQHQQQEHQRRFSSVSSVYHHTHPIIMPCHTIAPHSTYSLLQKQLECYSYIYDNTQCRGFRRHPFEQHSSHPTAPHRKHSPTHDTIITVGNRKERWYTLYTLSVLCIHHSFVLFHIIVYWVLLLGQGITKSGYTRYKTYLYKNEK